MLHTPQIKRTLYGLLSLQVPHRDAEDRGWGHVQKVFQFISHLFAVTSENILGVKKTLSWDLLKYPLFFYSREDHQKTKDTLKFFLEALLLDKKAYVFIICQMKINKWQ